MKITFELKDEQYVLIKSGDQVIGHIFSPAGTSHDMSNAIQVCGFDDAFDFWGCGIFNDGNRNPKKDIALLYNENSRRDNSYSYLDNSCGRCFYPTKKLGKEIKCKCKDLRIKTRGELIVKKLLEEKEEKHEIS